MAKKGLLIIVVPSVFHSVKKELVACPKALFPAHLIPVLKKKAKAPEKSQFSIEEVVQNPSVEKELIRVALKPGRLSRELLPEKDICPVDA